MPKRVQIAEDKLRRAGGRAECVNTDCPQKQEYEGDHEASKLARDS